MRTRERVLAALAILGAFIGGLGLILLSIFDTARHPGLHRGFLLLFMAGVALSAIFTIVEVSSFIHDSFADFFLTFCPQYRWLSKGFVSYRSLRIAYIMKAIIATILIVFAIVFAITLFRNKNVGGECRHFVIIPVESHI